MVVSKRQILHAAQIKHGVAISVTDVVAFGLVVVNEGVGTRCFLVVVHISSNEVVLVHSA